MIHVLKVGVDYETTPLAIREKVTFNEQAVQEAMLSLSEFDGIKENVILSTCNRTEIFAVVDTVEEGKQAIISFLKESFNLTDDRLLNSLHVQEDEAVYEHLFRLAVGLDSMVLGETQILGQVREAFLTAQQLKVTSKIFNELFKRIITFAKHAHHTTVIGEQAVSISYVAVELSKKIFGEMKGRHAVIIGAGEMGELSLKNLYSSGAEKVTVVNRSFERAKALASRHHAAAATLDQLDEVLIEADIVISSTGASVPILTKSKLQSIQKCRGYRELFLVDIAVPRDITADVVEVKNVYLYDIDDLQHVADENMEARKEAAQLIATQIEDELLSFHNWLDLLEVIPLIRALREKSLAIQERTLTSISNKIPDLSERELKVLEKHTQSIINQLIAEPIEYVKMIGGREDAKELKAIFSDTFGLEV